MRGRPRAKATTERRDVLKVSMTQKLRGCRTNMTNQSTKASPMLGHRLDCDAVLFMSCSRPLARRGDLARARSAAEKRRKP